MKGFGRLVRHGLCRRSDVCSRNSARYASTRLLFVSSTTTASSSTSQNLKAFSGFTSLKSSPISSLHSLKWDAFGVLFYGNVTLAGQRRTMFIQTQSTPNPSSFMFYPGKPVMEVGSADFPNARSAMNSPLAKALYGIDGITRVFFGSDFITVTKSEDVPWDILKPEIFAAIMDFYSSGKPLFLDANTAASMDTAISEDDSEIVAMIKELLETRIRPAVQDDGGDIEYRGFDPDTGIVKLRMQGACSGCPSSSVTLKSGIENMLMHYVPEVKAVEQELDDEDEAATLPG
ncbi:nifU-like protein 4, mitochondrial isoform X1 [Camellia sinensis]|uniref:nifU-like protein 4, mitochondrial isoform X1 n=1 Tax=Camellia sinensis TaxID=4442 RepID=UPI0010358ED6|nr:nifU-like protein 4, mitochondrial isoform X1 [Camellia sinensis]